MGGRGRELARCWEEVRERARRGERLSEWKREKQSFGKRGQELGVMEREREEKVFDFYKLEQRDRAGQREREREKR